MCDPLQTTDDGIEVYEGDKINHPGGWEYEITGWATEGATFEKLDYVDGNYEVTVETALNDIREHGFAEHAHEAN